MFEELKAIDKIEILENGIIQVRETTRILKDGIEIAKTYHRSAFAPGDDVNNMSQNIQDIANVVWTQQIIDDYQTFMQNANITQ